MLTKFASLNSDLLQPFIVLYKIVNFISRKDILLIPEIFFCWNITFIIRVNRQVSSIVESQYRCYWLITAPNACSYFDSAGHRKSSPKPWIGQPWVDLFYVYNLVQL